MSKIYALIADERGNIFDVPEFEGVGRVGEQFFKLKAEDLIKLPESADLMYLPQRKAIGFKRGEFISLDGLAVSAIRIHANAFAGIQKGSERADFAALRVYSGRFV